MESWLLEDPCVRVLGSLSRGWVTEEISYLRDLRMNSSFHSLGNQHCNISPRNCMINPEIPLSQEEHTSYSINDSELQMSQMDLSTTKRDHMWVRGVCQTCWGDLRSCFTSRPLLWCPPGALPFPGLGGHAFSPTSSRGSLLPEVWLRPLDPSPTDARQTPWPDALPSLCFATLCPIFLIPGLFCPLFCPKLWHPCVSKCQWSVCGPKVSARSSSLRRKANWRWSLSHGSLAKWRNRWGPQKASSEPKQGAAYAFHYLTGVARGREHALTHSCLQLVLSRATKRPYRKVDRWSKSLVRLYVVFAYLQGACWVPASAMCYCYHSNSEQYHSYHVMPLWRQLCGSLTGRSGYSEVLRVCELLLVCVLVLIFGFLSSSSV